MKISLACHYVYCCPYSIVVSAPDFRTVGPAVRIPDNVWMSLSPSLIRVGTLFVEAILYIGTTYH